MEKPTRAFWKATPVVLGCWLCAVVSNAETTNSTNSGPKLRWVDLQELHIEGKGWTNTQKFYDRLPANAEGVVRPPVWKLSKDSAGICARFVTDATELWARWTVTSERLAMPHMPASGVSGLDLYTRYQGKWQWLGATRPGTSLTTEAKMTTGMKPLSRECILYLPLYNGVDKIELGLTVDAKLDAPPPWRVNPKPLVFYGTSILQGGCASRPGMAYPAILGRRLDCATINLGFSGNAVCEPEVAGFLSELDPLIYVLDPLPNMRPEIVPARMPGFIAKLREAHPQTPIVLVEHVEAGDAPVVESRRAGYSKSNASLRQIFEQRVKAGDRKMFYIEGDKLLGDDGQGTVDRVHPTDLGFMRMCDVMEPVLKRAIKAAK